MKRKILFSARTIPLVSGFIQWKIGFDVEDQRQDEGAREAVITGTGGGLTSVMKVFLAASERERERRAERERDAR